MYIYIYTFHFCSLVMIMCTISIRTQFSCSFFSKPRAYLLGAAAHGTEDTGGAEAFVVLGVIGLYT